MEGERTHKHWIHLILSIGLKDCGKGNEYVIMYYRTNAICGLRTSSFVIWKFRLGKTTEKSFICQYGEYVYTITGMPKIFLHNNRRLAHKLISTYVLWYMVDKKWLHELVGVTDVYPHAGTCTFCRNMTFYILFFIEKSSFTCVVTYQLL